MRIPCRIYLLFIIASISACKSDITRTYALRDFSDSLRPYLAQIVSKGVVGYEGSTMSMAQHATDEELQQLSQSELPVLRATALRAMLDRPSFDTYSVMTEHLDDTALIVYDMGEWGWGFRMVSDDALEMAIWKDSASREKTIEEVITKHNYLKEAYKIVGKIEPREKYYPYIREMATRDAPFEDVEHALFGLAKFRKPTDIPLIIEVLLKENYWMNSLSFNLMEAFPDNRYLEVYEKYYPSSFYSRLSFQKNTNEAESYIASLATYKCERSAKILQAILDRNPDSPCYTSALRQQLAYSITSHDCKVYSRLGKQIEKYLPRTIEYGEGIALEDIDPPVDFGPIPIHWR